jgi:hypothetical protein
MKSYSIYLAQDSFFYNGRCAESNILRCRNQTLELAGTNLQDMGDSDYICWDLIDRNMMLSAGSTEAVSPVKIGQFQNRGNKVSRLCCYIK